jgi:hypothetical protein
MRPTLSRLFSSKSSAQAPSRREKPGVESLEGRRVPAVVVQPVGDTLQIIGDDAPNTVTISQTDDGYSVDVLNEQSYSSTYWGPKNRLVIDLKGGSDTLKYAFGKYDRPDLGTTKTLNINLGAGNDVVQLDFGQGPSIYCDRIIKAPLSIVLEGGEGNDQLSAEFTRFRQGTLDFLANMGTGDDQASVRMEGDVTNQSRINVKLNGQEDRDNLFLETLNPSPLEGGDGIFQQGTDSPIDLRLRGGDGNDTVRANLDGSFNDVVNLDLHGDGGRYDSGSDRVGAVLTLRAGTAGWINTKVSGGAGNDYLQLDDTGAGRATAHKNFLIDGGAGTDYFVLALTSFEFPQLNCEGTIHSLWEISGFDLKPAN